MSDGKNKNDKTKGKADDLLVDSTMSLGDHLEELRSRMILGILGLVAGTIVCLFFGSRIIRFIERPYFQVLRSRAKESEVTPTEPNSAEFVQALCTNILQALRSDPNAPPVDPNLVAYVQTVYDDTLATWKSDFDTEAAAATAHPGRYGFRLQTLAPADAFVSYVKIALIAGLIVSSPWVFYQIWMFVGAGLYAHEKKYVRKAVPFSTVLFITGALFFLFVVAPISLRFFLKFGDFINVQANWTFQKYVSFVTLLMLIFGIAFQTPIAILILNRTGLVSIESLRRSRKYVLVGIVIVAAMATPPDVISQITLAIPLYALFELGIVLSYIANKRREARADQA
jgi:sec-independent protein translocase protein TatC